MQREAIVMTANTASKNKENAVGKSGPPMQDLAPTMCMA